MAEHRYGCAVVMERERVIGIFTVTDALRVLSGKSPSSRPSKAPVSKGGAKTR